MKRVVINLIGIMFTVAAFAAGENIVTSQQFVDDELSNRQDLVQPKSGDRAMTAPVAPAAKGAIG